MVQFLPDIKCLTACDNSFLKKLLRWNALYQRVQSETLWVSLKVFIYHKHMVLIIRDWRSQVPCSQVTFYLSHQKSILYMILLVWMTATSCKGRCVRYILHNQHGQTQNSEVKQKKCGFLVAWMVTGKYMLCPFHIK